MTLKLVRYYERMPLHYNGEIYVVMCKATDTADYPTADTQDPGWRTIGRGGAIGSRNARDMVSRLGDQFQVLESETLVIKGIDLRISRRGCSRFATWDPTRQEGLEVEPVPKPDHCKPTGGADCRYYDFFEERRPVYDNIQITDGQIRFRVHTSAFRGSQTIEVMSDDDGKTWQWRSVVRSAVR